MKCYYYYKINNYDFTIASLDDYLIRVTKGKEKLEFKYQETAVIKKTKEELEEYFRGERTTFDIKIKLDGTNFQNKVWECMRGIPYGKTISYQELAQLAGNLKAARAVGNVCHINPILIIIPCHRVTAKHGLGGFGLDINFKIELLELESEKMFANKSKA